MLKCLLQGHKEICGEVRIPTLGREASVHMAASPGGCQGADVGLARGTAGRPLLVAAARPHETHTSDIYRARVSAQEPVHLNSSLFAV